MRDLKYRELIEWIDVTNKGTMTFGWKTDVTGSCMDAFTKNVRRMISQVLLPSYETRHSILSQMAFDIAEFRLLGKLENVLTDSQLAECDRLADEIRPKLRPKLRDGVFTEFHGAAEGIDRLAKEDEGFWIALSAHIDSFLLSIWSTFEIIAGDIWVASLNHRPEPLARAAINTQLNKEDDEIGDPSSQAKSPKLKWIESLIGQDYQASSEIGSLLKAAGKFDFNKLSGIREAYRCAFGKDMLSIFDGNDLEVLHGIRNVLIHHGGRVDHAYRKRMQREANKYKLYGIDQLALGEQIPTDGQMAIRLLDAMLQCAMSLVALVDKWFTDHP